jgi:MATE family multidrug resistance protein
MRGELRRTLTLAGPLILGQVAALAISFVDTVMAGRLGALTLAAVSIGGAVWSAALLFSIGVLMAVPPLVSQLVGAGRTGETGALMGQAMYIAAGLALLFLLALLNAEPLLVLVGVEPQIVPLAIGYLYAIAWGIPALCGFLLLRMTSEGLSIARAAMYFGLLGLALNIPANYVLMFGHLGFPKLGASGCGYASSLTQWVQFIGILIYMRRHRPYRAAHLFQRLPRPHWSTIRRLLHLGLPIGGSVFVEGSLFATVALLMGTLGAEPAAAHQVAINFSGLVFMIPLGVGMAMTVRIGNALGRRDPVGVHRAARAGFSIVLFTQCLSAVFMLGFPGLIAALYTDDLGVRALVVELLFLAAIFQLPDGLQVAAAGALRGIKDTRIPMLFTVVAYWLIGLPVGYVLGIHLDYGARGMWGGLIGGLSVAAMLMIGRFLRLSRHLDYLLKNT